MKNRSAKISAEIKAQWGGAGAENAHISLKLGDGTLSQSEFGSVILVTAGAKGHQHITVRNCTQKAVRVKALRDLDSRNLEIFTSRIPSGFRFNVEGFRSSEK